MKKLIGGTKDDNGIYMPLPIVKASPIVQSTESASDISIDTLLKGGLQAIRGIMRAISSDINSGMPSRETVMNLKDCMTMLSELKKKEKELLDSLSDEELEILAKE